MTGFKKKMTMGIPARIRKANNEKGFNLLEIIIAISILSIGLLAVAKMQAMSLGGDSFASAVTESSTWAQDKLEELLTLPWNHADLVAGNHPEPNPPAGHTINWTVADNNPVTNSKLITVTVTRQYKGVTKTTQLSSVMPQL